MQRLCVFLPTISIAYFLFTYLFTECYLCSVFFYLFFCDVSFAYTDGLRLSKDFKHDICRRAFTSIFYFTSFFISRHLFLSNLCHRCFFILFLFLLSMVQGVFHQCSINRIGMFIVLNFANLCILLPNYSALSLFDSSCAIKLILIIVFSFFSFFDC